MWGCLVASCTQPVVQYKWHMAYTAPRQALAVAGHRALHIVVADFAPRGIAYWCVQMELSESSPFSNGHKNWGIANF